MEGQCESKIPHSVKGFLSVNFSVKKKTIIRYTYKNVGFYWATKYSIEKM